MIPRKHKERKGKRHCDLCEQEKPPIHEYSFRIHGHAVHWFDLCADCASVDREVRDGFLVGIHKPTVRPPARKHVSTAPREP